MRWSQRGHKWRYNMAHTSCILDKQDYTHARICARTPTHAQTDMQYCFSASSTIRDRVSVLRRMYIACRVSLNVQFTPLAIRRSQTCCIQNRLFLSHFRQMSVNQEFTSRPPIMLIRKQGCNVLVIYMPSIRHCKHRTEVKHVLFSLKDEYRLQCEHN
jgi:hypothetical protein